MATAYLNPSSSSDDLISPIRMTLTTTLTETFDPHHDQLELPRPTSPTSTRATYVRSRPTSSTDLEGEGPLHFAGFPDLASVDASLDRDFRRIQAAYDKLEGIRTTKVSPPSHTKSTSFSRYHQSTGSRRQRSRHYIESDKVSIVTTRTTISTFRAVRNPEVTPPVLRQREVGKKYTFSSDVVLSDVKDEEQKKDKKGWKAPGRIKERFSLLFKSRTENAGILDRDAAPAQKPKKKKSFSFLKSTKVTQTDTTQDTRVGDQAPVVGRKVRNASFSSKNALDATDIPPVPALTPLSAEQLRKQQVRRSRSFAGFRGSVIDDTLPVSPIVFSKFGDDDDEFDEITREATRVNEGVRRNYSYEESILGQGEEED